MRNISKRKDSAIKRILAKLVFAILFVVGMFIMMFVLTDVIMVETRYTYGVIDSKYLLILNTRLQEIDASEDISKEQYENLLREYNNIKEAIFSDSKITLKMVRAYNKALKQSGISNYDAYQIILGRHYSSGLKDGFKSETYKDVIELMYYNGFVPKEKYLAFSQIYDGAACKKDELAKIIECEEDIIQYIRSKGTCDIDFILSSC